MKHKINESDKIIRVLAIGLIFMVGAYFLGKEVGCCAKKNNTENVVTKTAVE